MADAGISDIGHVADRSGPMPHELSCRPCAPHRPSATKTMINFAWRPRASGRRFGAPMADRSSGGRATGARLRATPDPPERTLQRDIGPHPQPGAVHHAQGIVRGARMRPITRRDAIEALAAGVQPCFMCRPDRGLRVD
ncbi:DUF6233 domain-containing protein [Streptomyces decoyicus]|uniref:DUF6233 domain-containing protein n=1 Tax=Streptomyces decoyicus TaxID=249567 RepID=UPI003C12BD66